MQNAGAVPTTRALWICACVTMDDAPTWLIYEGTDGTLIWSRIPDGADVSDIVSAGSITGDHTDPTSVLEWLRRQAPTPWAGGDGVDNDDVLDWFTRRLVRPTA
jgi:hypothetical protein